MAVKNILCEFEINCGDYYRRKLKGPRCKKMMLWQEELGEKVCNYISSKPTNEKFEDNDIILFVVSFYCRLLGHLDTIFRLLRTEQFHTTIEIEINWALRYIMQ